MTEAERAKLVHAYRIELKRRPTLEEQRVTRARILTRVPFDAPPRFWVINTGLTERQRRARDRRMRRRQRQHQHGINRPRGVLRRLHGPAR